MTILTTLPTDTFVVAAFAELLEDVGNFLSTADGKDERAFWRRQQTALNKAQYHFLNGVRPQVADGAYLMPSASSSGLMVYRLVTRGGVVECDCKAGQNGILCHHHMAINVYERAAELESEARKQAEIISGGGPETTPETALPLYDPAPPQFTPIPPYLLPPPPYLFAEDEAESRLWAKVSQARARYAA
jgi:hypothetical protein